MSLFIPGLSRATDANGNPLSGATWSFYRKGTLTPITVYTTSDRDVEHEGAVEADAGGMFPLIYLDPQTVPRAILRTSGGTTIQDIDPYSGSGETAGYLSPEDFGGVGDGTTDDYDAFVALAAYVSTQGGGKVRFGHGKTYRIDRVQRDWTSDPNYTGSLAIAYVDCHGLEIDLNGSKIDVKGDFYRGASGTTDQVRSVMPFWFRGGSNITIRNGEIDMNVDQMSRLSSTGETFAHALVVSGTNRFVGENLYIHHSPADGILIRYDERVANYPTTPYTVAEQVTLRNVRSERNARQGISIIGCRGFLAENCEFNLTGYTAASGVTVGSYTNHAPSAGADVEPDGSTVNKVTGEIVFLRCKFDENLGWPLLASNPVTVDDVSALYCEYSQTVYNAASTGAIVGCVKNLKIEGGRAWNVGIWPGFSYSDSQNEAMEGYCRGLTIAGDHASFRPFFCTRTTGPHFALEGSKINVLGTAPSAYGGTSYEAQWAGTNLRLTNNRIYVAKETYAGAGATHNFCNLQRTYCHGNRWWTDLTDSGKRFVVNYNASDDTNRARSSMETYPLGRIGPHSGLPVSYGSGIMAAGRLLLGTDTDARLHDTRSAEPSSGDYVRGQIVWNRDPSASGKIGWVCTTSGAAGSTAVFKTFGAIDA